MSIQGIYSSFQTLNISSQWKSPKSCLLRQKITTVGGDVERYHFNHVSVRQIWIIMRQMLWSLLTMVFPNSNGRKGLRLTCAFWKAETGNKEVIPPKAIQDKIHYIFRFDNNPVWLMFCPLGQWNDNTTSLILSISSVPPPVQHVCGLAMLLRHWMLVLGELNQREKHIALASVQEWQVQGLPSRSVFPFLKDNLGFLYCTAH